MTSTFLSRVSAELRALKFTLSPEVSLLELQRAVRDGNISQAMVVSEMAGLEAMLGWFEEAKNHARLVLDHHIPTADPVDLARARLAHAAALLAEGEQNAIEHFDAGIQSARTTGQRATDIIVVGRINRASALYILGHRSVAIEEFDRLLSEIHRMGYTSSMLLGIRTINIDYNLMVADEQAGEDRATSILKYQTMADGAFDADYPAIAGFCFEGLSAECKRLDLYSQALHYCDAAERAWRAADQKTRIPNLWSRRGEILKSIGDTDGARQIGRQLLALGDTNSASRRQRAMGASLLGSVADYVGNTTDSIRYNLLAARFSLESPYRLSVDPVGPLDELVNACAAARALGDEASLANIRRLVDTWKPPRLSDHPDDLVGSEIVGDIIGMVKAGLHDDLMGFEQHFERFRGRPPVIEVFSSTEFDRFRRECLRKLFGHVSGGQEALAIDLGELWHHVIHLQGEDDELVRTRYMVANVRPVLDRILRTNPSLEPHHKFELVELTRVTGFDRELALAAAPQSIRGAVRNAVHSQMSHDKTGWTTSLVLRRPLAWDGDRPSCLAHIAGVEPYELSSLVNKGRLGEAAGILQIYLQANMLHWCWFNYSDSPCAGHYAIPSEAISKLGRFRSTMVPTIGPYDVEAVSRFHLRTIDLPAVAALRTALSPMVDSRQVARNLATYLPSEAREGVLDFLSGLPFITMEDLSQSVSMLIPSIVWDGDSSGRILLSCGENLAHIPLVLAVGSCGTPLLNKHHLTVLPPIDLLAAIDSHVRPADVRWKLLRVENALGDLNFAGDQAMGQSGNLLLAPDIAATTALLYRGHLVENHYGRPGLSGVILGDAHPALVTQAELRTQSKHLRAPSRVALMACRAAGWDTASEWGGIGPALIERGVQDFLAPMWSLIDSDECEKLDGEVARILCSADVGDELWQFQRSMLNELLDGSNTIGPHWWTSLTLLSL